MKSTKELRQEIQALWDEYQGIKDVAAKDSDRSLSDEESVKANELLDNIDILKRDFKLAEKDEAISPLMAETNGEERKIIQEPVEKVDGNQGWESMGHMIQAVVRAGSHMGEGSIGGKPTGFVDRRLLGVDFEGRAVSGMSEGIPQDGGFLVQQDFSTELLTAAHNTGILANKTRKFTISAAANSMKIPGVDETSRVAGSRWGGILLYWLEQAAEKTASKPKFRQMEWSLKKIAGLCYVTDEMLSDAASIGAILTLGFGEELGFKLDDAMINGTGAGQPVGILNANCLVSIAKETGQSAKTIIWDNIMKMYAQFWARSMPNGIWLINQSCLVQLMSMTIPVGTGGIPVWMPANLAQGRPNSTLMGMPVIAIEQCATLGTVGDIILCDWTQYVNITKGGLQTAQSMHVRFIYDEQVYRFVYRVDGQPLWSVALTPFKDATTSQKLSPFVALATRS